MSTLAQLKEELDRLVREASRARERGRATLVQTMRDLDKLRDDSLAQGRRLIDEIVVPRLALLAESLPNGTAPCRAAEGTSATVVARASDQYPVGAEITVGVTTDSDYAHILITLKASVPPQEGDTDAREQLSVDARVPDRAAIAAFVEDGVLRFTKRYLALLCAESPVSRPAIVIDPVCGMAFPPSQAACAVRHRFKTYYFCVQVCRDRFQADPERYAPTD